VLETLLAPGFYVILTIGLGLGYSIIASFTSAVDSSGFNPHLNPALDLVVRSLSGAFGPVLVEKLFAEGPFVLALFVSFAPVFIYLTITSVYRFGMEKTAGVVELLAYGPADGTSYLMASFLKDTLFTLIALTAVLLFFLLVALVNNLVLGPLFFCSLSVVFFLALAIFAYGVLCSILTSNASSAIALFLAILVFFSLVLGGSFIIASVQVRTVSSFTAAVVQWFSPFFYFSFSLRSFSGGNTAGFLGGIALLLVLSAMLLALSHVAIGMKGVRA
jgi:hypothetical protein